LTHEVVRTRAGAVAMRDIEVGEVMHPGVGPIAEAELLYVQQSRLADRLVSSSLVLFDVGLGAGSNAVAARRVAGAGRLSIISFERDLGALALAVEHAADFGLDGEHLTAARALLATGAHRDAHIDWQLRHGELLSLLATEPLRADIVFWDPFSPKANPSLWTIAAFAALRRVAGPRCTLYTYSASTATRVALLLAGWAVGIGDPIGEKKETTAAAIDAADLARPLSRRWLTRLSVPKPVVPQDAPANVAALVAALPQFTADP